MPRAELVNGRIHIESEYREKEQVQLVPGVKWAGKLVDDERIWHAPCSWTACQVLRGVFGESLEIGDELTKWAWDFYQNRVEPANRYREANDWDGWEETPFAEDLRPLFPLQRAGTRFLCHTERALMGDETGGGKTIQSATALKILNLVNGDALPALIVCTNSMKYTWEKELAKWAPEFRVGVADGSATAKAATIASLRDGELDVVIVNWEALRGLSKLESYGNYTLKHCTACDTNSTGKPSACERCPKILNEVEWRTIVADESHKAKEARAKQTMALKAVARGSRYRFALTATPVANNPADAWSQLNFLDEVAWPAKTKFLDRWALTSWNAFGGLDIVGLNPATRDEFYRVFDHYFIRRPKEAILPHKAKIDPQERIVEMAAKQKKAYTQMVKNMIAELDDGTFLAATNPLAKFTRLSQFAAATCVMGEDGKVAMTEPSCKVDALLEIIDESPMTSIVVFAESKELIRLCKARLDKEANSSPRIAERYRWVACTGDESPIEREKGKEKFQDGEVPIMLLTLGAGGEGITLTKASTAVWLQRSYSLIKNVQGEGRYDRHGQLADTVTVIDVVTKDTIEDDKQAAIALKEGRFEEVVRDEEKLRRLLAEEPKKSKKKRKGGEDGSEG